MSTEITNWLRGLGLEQYASAFEDNAIDAGVLPELTADDLKDLGVNLVGHRRKLLAAIAALRDQASPAETRSASAPSLPLIPNDPGPKSMTPAERRQLDGDVLRPGRLDGAVVAARSRGPARGDRRLSPLRCRYGRPL